MWLAHLPGQPPASTATIAQPELGLEIVTSVDSHLVYIQRNFNVSVLVLLSVSPPPFFPPLQTSHATYLTTHIDIVLSLTKDNSALKTTVSETFLYNFSTNKLHLTPPPLPF